MSAEERPQMNAQQVRAAIAAARADVLAAVEKGKSLTNAELAELRQTVQEAIGAYEALLTAEPTRRDEIEHTLGRQIIDLRRQAALLPQMESGRAVPISADRVAAGGGQPFIETRPPPSWALKQSGPTARREKRLSPGDEVEAWCGPCGGLRTHSIIAMVGDEPKQVVCEACGARHGYRLTPARGRSDGGDAPRPVRAAATKRKKTAEEVQEERRQQELAALRQELEAAKTVIPFDPRRRYKAGEVIEHPEYGRGKVETALKTTILVRFGTGRRSLILK